MKDPNSIKEAVDDPSGPRYGRPSDRFGPPTALFSRELAILKHDLEHLEGFTPDLATIESAFRIVLHSTKFYPSEKERESSLREDLKALLPGETLWQQPVAGGAAKPYGIWFQGAFAYLIYELKNEQGLGGDPFLQA